MARQLAFDADTLARFKRQGFIKLKQLISADEIEELRRWTEESSIWTPDDPQAAGGGLRGFSNTTFQTGTRQTIFERLAEDENLRATLRTLAAQRLIYTNGNRFTLTPDHKGSPWHFGRMSFCYIEPLTMGYSLWVPLDPINPHDQHGGMAWVPDDILSARGGFQMWSGYVKRVMSLPPAERAPLEAARKEQFRAEQGFPMLGPYDRAYLDLVSETAEFEVGDAFFFNKFVWHRTEPLRPGKMAMRVACVLRYISEDATFARDLMLAATTGMSDKERQDNGIFGSYLEDIEQGALIRSSKHCPPPR